jgi:uncharacterized OB-fold protein
MRAGMTQDWLLSDELAPSTEDDVLAPLYAGAARGELVVPFCPACGLALELEQQVCDGCGSADPEWRAVEPRGHVHSATLVHRLEPGLVRAEHPYPVADIELAAGHRLVLTSDEPAPDPPAIGDAVSIGFRHLGGVAVPAYHRPVELEESR